MFFQKKNEIQYHLQPSFSLHSGFIQPFSYDLVQMEWKEFSYYYQLILNTKNIMKFPCSAFQTRFMAFIWPLIFFFKEEYILFFEVSPNSIINICDYNFSLFSSFRFIECPLSGLYMAFMWSLGSNEDIDKASSCLSNLFYV